MPDGVRLINYVPGEICNRYGWDGRPRGDLKTSRRYIADDQIDPVLLDESNFLLEERRHMVVQVAARLERRIQIHAQTIRLDNACVYRLSSMGDSP